jgi:uncharacterized membrane protein YfcA
MGLFLISNLTFLFKKPVEINRTEKPSKLTLSLIGFSAGFLSGLTGAVGQSGLAKVAGFRTPQTVLWLIKHWFYALTCMVEIATFAKPKTLSVSP